MVLVGVSVTCGLQMLFQVLGPFGVLLNPVLAFPVAYVCMRSGVVPALMALAAVTALVSQMVGTVHGLFYVLQFGAASIVLPILLRRGISWFKSVVVSLLLTCSAVAVVLVGYADRSTTTVTAFVADYIDVEVGKARLVYEQADIPKDQLRELLSVLDSTAEFFKQAYAGLGTVALAVVLVATVALLCKAARGRYVVPGELFQDIHLPEWLIWFLIAAGFSLMLDMTNVQLVALNVLTVLFPLYFLQGVAIMTFFLRKKAFSTLSRVFVYILMLVVNPLPLLVTAIGVFDMWFDFRKPRVKTT